MKHLLRVCAFIGCAAFGWAQISSFPPASGGGGGGTGCVPSGNANANLIDSGAGTCADTTGTGLLRNGAAAASELSGDVTTSGTNAVTVVRLNGTLLSGLGTGLLKNTTATGVPSIAAGSDICGLLTLTGNVTTSAGCATTIGAAQVSNTMLAGSIAASKLVGTDIPQYTSVSFSATPTFTSTSPVVSSWTETLTGNVTSSILAAPTTGQILNFKICQDGTGGRTFAWPTGFSSAYTISPTASACTKEIFFWDGSNAILQGSSVDSGAGYSAEIAAPSGNPASGFQFPWFDSTDHTFKTKDSSGNVYTLPLVKASRTANQFVINIPTTGIQQTSAIVAADLPGTPLITPGTSPTLVGPRGYAVCTGTCTVTVPAPLAGYEFCVVNDDNVATAITLSALGSSAMYENSARTAYGTAGTGTLVVAAAAANKVCLLGRDSTHYLTVSASGGAITVN